MGNVLQLWRWLRRRTKDVRWRAAVDALRPHSSAIWQAFGEAEKRRFMRHARPWWDVHRHRIATEVAQRLKDLIGSGQLEVVAGRIRSMRETEDGVEVEIARRGRDRTELRRFDTVVNCTGPLGAMARSANPVVRQMLDDGLIAVDPLGIGLDVDERDRAGDRRLGARADDQGEILGDYRRARYTRAGGGGGRRYRDGAWTNESGSPEDGDLVQGAPKVKVPKDVSDAVRTLIRWAGDDPEREGLLDTPARVARAWREYARGYAEDPALHLSRTFEEVGGYDEIILLKDIPFQSHCEHHLAPIIGKAAIAYLPGDKVVGISKLARVLHGFARRLQVQERLTAQVADCIWENLEPKGVAVVIEASHACMTARGVGTPGVMMTTSRMMGIFRSATSAAGARCWR